MNFHLLAKMVGLLLTLESVAMLACGVFAWFDYVDESHAAVMPMFTAAGLTFIAGILLVIFGMGAWFLIYTVNNPSEEEIARAERLVAKWRGRKRKAGPAKPWSARRSWDCCREPRASQEDRSCSRIRRHRAHFVFPETARW